MTTDPFADRPWIYSKPPGQENFKKWVEEWNTVLLQVSERENIHLINKMDLKQVIPVNRLSDADFDSLIDELMEKDNYVYWGKGNIRIYWKSINAWANNLVEKAMMIDKSIIFGLDALREVDERMVFIPKSDQIKIMQTAVDQDKARWMEKENQVLKIL